MAKPGLTVAAAAALCCLMTACSPAAPAAPDMALNWTRLEQAQPGQSTGPWTAYLHRTLISPPGADVPAAIRTLSGYWQGWIGRDRSGSVAVEIAHIDDQKAVGQYAYAGIQNTNGNLPANREFAMTCAVMDGTYLDCTISRPGLTGLKVYLKARGDGNVMIRYTGDGRHFAGGVMSR